MFALPTPYTVATKAVANATSQLGRIIEILHDVNQAQHCTQNANRRGIPTRGFKDFGPHCVCSK